MPRARERLAGVGDDTFARFHRAKRQAQARMDRDDLTNDEFLALLLDVYDLHLDQEADDD